MIILCDCLNLDNELTIDLELLGGHLLRRCAEIMSLIIDGFFHKEIEDSRDIIC